MPSIPFDVNDRRLRQKILLDTAPKALAKLQEDTEARWGEMTPQQMVEHLLWAFELSAGESIVVCATPPPLLARARAFLFDDRHSPRRFKNPALLAGIRPLQHETLRDAKRTLLAEMDLFAQRSATGGAERYVHPVFGPLDIEEWSRAHFKHVFHHLRQFGLVEEAAA